MSDEETSINTRGLERLLRAFSEDAQPVAHVGILGSSSRNPNGSSKGVTTNAEVGAVHEYGSPARGIPARSFLRVPISEKLDKEMEKSGLFTKTSVDEVIAAGTLLPLVKKIAVISEGIVLDAFDTGGDGKWAPHSPGYSNNTGNLLVDTGQLRNSITSEVKE